MISGARIGHASRIDPGPGRGSDRWRKLESGGRSPSSRKKSMHNNSKSPGDQSKLYSGPFFALWASNPVAGRQKGDGTPQDPAPRRFMPIHREDARIVRRIEKEETHPAAHLPFADRAAPGRLLTRGRAVKLDLDLVFEARVVFAQDVEHFLPAEVIRDRGAFGKTLSQCRAAKKDAVFLAVRAGP